MYAPEPVAASSSSSPQSSLLPWPDSCTQMLTKRGFTNPTKIGDGGYSVVYRFTMTTAKVTKEVAVKFIDMEKTTQIYRLKFMPRELEALRSLKHPHIVRILAGLNDKEIVKADIPHRYWIVMELCTTDLFDISAKFPKFMMPETTGRKLLFQVSQALKFMKDRKWAHRDIKPENILIRADSTAALTDFSFVRKLQPGELSHTPICTMVYAAPEVLKLYDNTVRDYDAFAADIWSLACVLFMVHAGFGLVNHSLETVSQILDDQRQVFYRIHTSAVSHQLKDLLHKMTETDHKMRPTIEQVMLDVWFTAPDHDLKCCTSQKKSDEPRSRARVSKSIMAVPIATPAEKPVTATASTVVTKSDVVKHQTPPVAAAAVPPTEKKHSHEKLPAVKVVETQSKGTKFHVAESKDRKSVTDSKGSTGESSKRKADESPKGSPGKKETEKNRKTT